MFRATTALGVLVLVCAPAGGAIQWMQFEGGLSEVTLAPSDFINVEIWLDLLPGEEVTGLFYRNAWAEDVYQTDLSGRAPWQLGADIVHGRLGDPTQWVHFFTANPVVGPGSFLIGTQTLHLGQWNPVPPNPPYYEVMFDGDPTVSSGLLDDNLLPIPFDPPAVDLGYSGYYTWGQGASAISGKSAFGDYDLPADPLLIHIPEPAALTLLALGALAILRRTR